MIQTGNAYPTKATPGDRLQELRKEAGYTQKYVAEKIGVNIKTYNSWEADRYTTRKTDSGKYAPVVVGIKAESLLSLADLYDVTVDYLLCRTDCRAMGGDMIAGLTGLSDAAVQVLQRFQDAAHPVAPTIYALLIDYKENGSDSLVSLLRALCTTPADVEIDVNGRTGRLAPAAAPGTISLNVGTILQGQIGQAAARIRDKSVLK